jgi:hypothetical protein
MGNITTTSNNSKWLHLGTGAVMLVSFFLPWVSWKEIKVNGYDLPAGNFFRLSEKNFKLGNPFPQFDFTFYAFWLIPVLVILTAILVLQNKKSSFTAFIAGTMTLSLVTVFYLFTNTLVDLGVGNSAINMMQPAAYIASFAAVAFIITSLPLNNWLKKLAWIIIGPVIAFASYKAGEKYVMAETFTKTEAVTADFTVMANDLIREFTANDTAANSKYREKTIIVNGTTSLVERMSDSTTNIQFTDSTGSYIAFSFEREKYDQVKEIKTGDAVSLKGSCSGSIYSDILGTTAITFKRSTLNKITL